MNPSAADASWRLDPRLSLEWWLERVRSYLARLPERRDKDPFGALVAREGVDVPSR